MLARTSQPHSPAFARFAVIVAMLFAALILGVSAFGCAGNEASWPAFREYYHATSREYLHYVENDPHLQVGQKQRRLQAVQSAGRVLAEAPTP